jgi:predicted PurR-regulated permease PerM
MTRMEQLLPLRTNRVTIGGRFFQYRGVILLAFFLLTVYLNISFLKPLTMGAILAVVLHPLMGHFDRLKVTHKFSRTLRAAIITLAFTLIILIPLGILIFLGVQEVIDKVQALHMSDFTGASTRTIAEKLGLGGVLTRAYDIIPMSQAKIQDYLQKGLAAAGAFGAAVLQDLITSIPGTLFSNFVLILTMFFLLIDGPKAVNFIRHNSIFNHEQTDRLIDAAASLSNSVIVATIASGAVQSLIVGMVAVFTGAGNVILVTFITFISSFLPVVGTAPAIIFMSLQAFIAGNNTAGLIWLLTIPVVAASDNVVRPYVLKGGAQLHPLVGFVAAFGALNMIGFYGLFIGPIVAGMFFTLLPMVTRTYPRSPR